MTQVVNDRIAREAKKQAKRGAMSHNAAKRAQAWLGSGPVKLGYKCRETRQVRSV